MTRGPACFLTVILAFGAPWRAGATEASHRLIVEGTRVNVRAEPSLKSRVLFKVSRGDMLKSLGRSDDWHWIEDSHGRRGHVHSALVSLIEAPTTSGAGARPEEYRDIQALDEDGVKIVQPGPSSKALLIGGAVLVGVTALLLSSGGGDSKATDADGDGFAPNQGDCDDGDFMVNPNGFVKAMAASDVAEQSVDCADNSTWRIVVANNSCAEVTISGLRIDRSVLDRSRGCDCAPHESMRLTPHRSVVPPGSAVTVFETNATAGCDALCARSGYCRFRSVYTVDTSAGALMTPPIRHQVRYGSQCPLCSLEVH
ncbi:MAG: SH3 domain-containing protein [Vicinamibacteria bacterium]|nr:SH3 domain-containing protein [Vicinamibacteria bacterium]